MEDATLEVLVRRLLDSAGREGDLRQAFDQSLASVSVLVQRILVSRFGAGDYVNDAAQSVCRTFLRQLEEGELPINGPGALEHFLVSTAIAKAYAVRKRSGRTLGSEAVVGANARQINGADAPVLSEMKRHLEQLLDRMRVFLENETHRVIFESLFENAYGVRRWTQQEIAQAADCTVKTVQRVCRTFDRVWLPMVTDARRELCAWRSSFEGGPAAP